MWLNQQTLDAIRIMIEVAQRQPALSRASEIAAATGITVMNVQKTVHDLRVAGLLSTLRGRNGGVRLARAAKLISISEIVRALEPADCPASFLPHVAAEARLSKLLFQAHRGFFQPLEAATLSELVDVA